MAVLVQPQLPTTFTVNVQPMRGASNTPGVYSFPVTVTRPDIMTQFGPITAPDIDGRYQPALNIFITY